MNDKPISARTWRIGELAAAAGMTVRTLHHYEHVGLLKPSARSEGGHRLYGDLDVQRLYRIRVLRSLGLSLEEIGHALDRDTGLPEMLHDHLAQVEAELKRASELRDRLRSISAHAGSGVDARELLDTIDAMSRLERHVQERGGEAPVDADRIELAWRTLGDQLRGCMDAGVNPDSERTKTLAMRARNLIHDFADHDPALIQDLARIRSADPPRDLAGWDPELTKYLDRALAALDETEE